MSRRLSSFTRFGLLGAFSFTLNLALTVVLHEVLGAPEEAAFAIGLLTVFTVNFLACRYLVFDAARGDPKRQLAGFVAGSVVFRLAEYLAFLLLHTAFGVHYAVAIVAILVTSVVAKFVYYRHAVFHG